MLACRVCVRLGIEDPEQWLETVDDGLFELWQAYYACEPFGDEQRLLARCVSLLSVLVACKTQDADAVQQVPDLMPPQWVWQPERKDVDLHSQLQAVEQAFRAT